MSGLGRYDEAYASLNEVIASEDVVKNDRFDYMTVAYSMVECAEALIKQGKLPEAGKMLTQASAKSNYIFMKYVDYRVKSCLYFIANSKSAGPAASSWTATKVLKLV